MYKLQAFTLFVLLLVNLSTQDVVKVSVYYEALCPDSVRFITKQLSPAYPTLKNHITLEFIPYGKAFYYKLNEKWQFSCQHGAPECYGNKMQACALNQNATQDKKMEYVNCVMGQFNPAADTSLSGCASANGVISWNQIVACRDGGMAENLLANHGFRTNSLTPRITFVPTILFNDVFNVQTQNDALKDFLWTACRIIGEDKPTGCPAKKRSPTRMRYNFNMNY